MENAHSDLLTTRELAELLRIKERKVYDLAASGEVPCVRVVGKLLFPRADIENWIRHARSGPGEQTVSLPAIVAGSHDPLLEWALRESGCGLAAFFDGSHDGLKRLGNFQAVASGLHIHEHDGWNKHSVSQALGNQPVVLIEFARRQRGLIVASGNPLGIHDISDVCAHRFARRQNSAASQTLFAKLLGATPTELNSLKGPQTPARTEDDVARYVLEGQADSAFGLATVARQFRLDFVPITEERFDLVFWRRAWFESPLKSLNGFLHSGLFAERAKDMGGYDIENLGIVHFNGECL